MLDSVIGASDLVPRLEGYARVQEQHRRQCLLWREEGPSPATPATARISERRRIEFSGQKISNSTAKRMVTTQVHCTFYAPKGASAIGYEASCTYCVIVCKARNVVRTYYGTNIPNPGRITCTTTTDRSGDILVCFLHSTIVARQVELQLEMAAVCDGDVGSSTRVNAPLLHSPIM